MFCRFLSLALAPLVLLAAPALADSFTDFEPAGFTPGETVHNHQPDGTEADPPIRLINNCVQAWSVFSNLRTPPGADEEVVLLDDGTKAWRLSQGRSPGNTGTAPHTANSGFVSGETTASNDAGCGPATTPNYYGEVSLRSATGASQPGLLMHVTANSGDTRHAFTRFLDDGNGIDIIFFDTVNGCDFNGTLLDLDLDPGVWHTVGIEIFFMEGLASGPPATEGAEGNDIVNLYVDNLLVHTGTTWESCVGARSVDRLLISSLATSFGDEDPAFLGNGLLFDDVLVTDLCPPGRCLDFGSQGECLRDRIRSECGGLLGLNRSDCIREQVSFCRELFD